jgi:hypothetical protein
VVAAALLDERRRRWLEKLLVGTGVLEDLRTEKGSS